MHERLLLSPLLTVRIPTDVIRFEFVRPDAVLPQRLRGLTAGYQ